MSSSENYNSHKWVWIDVSTVDEHEKTRVCEDCGCEDLGDPDEFSDVIYPHCDEMFELNV